MRQNPKNIWNDSRKTETYYTGYSPKGQGRLYNKLFTFRLTGDYNDHYDLEEQDVLPLFAPTEQLIADVAQEARESLKKNNP